MGVSAIYAFGDSLSDTRSVWLATTSLVPCRPRHSAMLRLGEGQYSARGLCGVRRPVIVSHSNIPKSAPGMGVASNLHQLTYRTAPSTTKAFEAGTANSAG